MKEYTVCYMFDRRCHNVLFTRRRKPPYVEKLNGVGGKFEQNETPEECVVREVKEETGIELTKNQLHKIVTIELPVDYAFDHETSVLHIFAAVIDESKVDYNTCEQLEWLDVDYILHAKPKDDCLAGDGEIPYIINLAVTYHGFGKKNNDTKVVPRK